MQFNKLGALCYSHSIYVATQIPLLYIVQQDNVQYNQMHCSNSVATNYTKARLDRLLPWYQLKYTVSVPEISHMHGLIWTQ